MVEATQAYHPQMLHFCHRHVFRAHHHRDATRERVGRKLVYGVTSCGASFSANMSYSSFEP
jgi:hypothetical protein